MKLILCEKCNDIVALTTRRRRCECLKSSGHYLSDKRTVSVHGACIVLGISNAEIFAPDKREGKWFVITEPHEAIKRI